uniref:Uncharacterized protein n=1 Tax=Periophthalmus magnuspinnatus TaxID=409849 RepID=A0A3B4BDQ6_9GOBI
SQPAAPVLFSLAHCTQLLQNSGWVYSSRHDFNPDEIREKLLAFPGGSIDLYKQDSGIALLTVNNPSRMNAFSGISLFQRYGM